MPKHQDTSPSMPDAAGTPPAADTGGQHPPAGTYPAPGDAPAEARLPDAPPPPYEPKPRGRRVGTITMALALIATGVVLLLRLVLPGLDYITIAKCSPVILVLLGVELLVAAARQKEGKVRFDGLSVFVCLLLIIGSLVGAVLPELVYREIEGERVSRRLELELEQRSFELVTEENTLPVSRIDWYVNVQSSQFAADMTVADLAPEHYVQMRVFFKGGYANKTAFVADCQAVMALLQELVPRLEYASFYSYPETQSDYAGDDERYSLWMNGRWQMQMSTQEMEEATETEYWLEHDGYYVSEAEYRDRQEHPEWYGYDDGEEDDDLPDDGDLSYSIPVVPNGQGDTDSSVSAVDSDSSDVSDIEDSSVSLPAAA